MKTQFICITIATALLLTSSAHAQWATLKGQFLYGEKGVKIPDEPKLVPTKDVEVCGKHQLFNESLVINEDNRGIANILIWAYKPKGKPHPDYAETADDTVKIDNAGCRFEPHAVAVRVGQKFVVGNSDPVAHNSLINFFKNDQINPIIPANGTIEVDLKKAETIPSKVACSIHPWMTGIILVQDHPYMAVTDKDGNFEIKNLPAGKLSLKVWHEKVGYVQDVSIDGKKTTWKRGKYDVNLKKDENHTYIVDPKPFEKAN